MRGMNRPLPGETVGFFWNVGDRAMVQRFGCKAEEGMSGMKGLRYGSLTRATILEAKTTGGMCFD